MAQKGRHLTMWIALDSKVLVVAVSNEGIYWAAYIGAIAGKSHEDEWSSVAEHGTKLHKAFARLLFPDFAKEYIWRE